MKKKFAITIGAIALTVVLGLGIYHSDAANADPALSEADIRVMVESQYPGTITEIELEKNRNSIIYEVKVDSNGKRYEIKLDGDTGEVLKLEEKTLMAAGNVDTDGNIGKNGSSNLAVTEKEGQSNSRSETSSKDNTSSDKNDDTSDQVDDSDKNTEEKDDKTDDGKSSKKATIDTDTAKSIALKEFPGTVTELELDEDDGRLIYEIEIETVSGEAEFEIDAYTGEILVISIDSDLGVSIGDDDDDDD
ncbi:PepSY domain-containing protein [Ornithinibacillus salinisoli]|uniref:PepSY domain-containing protein n=1 Tax=Ornithinibacillus salinisoli TaxID=1848459 RepID=A0ABW4VXH3_9BACI